ncbi:MAG: Thiol-disulfide oxidoreductase ResA [Planctomycetota bacterium]|jgi:thiol-disulfide isomerase/thioredoxin
MKNLYCISTPSKRQSTKIGLLISVVSWIFFSPILIAQDAGKNQDTSSTENTQEVRRSSILRLKNGDFIEGELAPSSSPERIGWKSTLLSVPVELPIASVRSLELNKDNIPNDNLTWNVELKNGDRTSGKLVRWDEKEIEISNAISGSVTIPTDKVGRALQSSPDMKWIFDGPRDATAWKPFSGDTAWTSQGGALVSDQIGSRVIGDVRLPAKAAIDIRVAWEGKPGFVLAFGVDATASNINSAFRIETWQNQLVLLRQAKGKAEITELEDMDSTQQYLDLSLFLDQQTERMVVYSGRGKLLGDLTMVSQNPAAHSAMAVANHSESFRIERVRVREWTMPLPVDRAADASYVLNKDGEAVTGRIISGTEAKGWTLQAEAGEIVIPWQDVTEIIQQDKLATEPKNEKKDGNKTDTAKGDGNNKTSDSFEELLEAIKEGDNVIAQDDAKRKLTDNTGSENGDVPTFVQVELTDGSRWRGQWIKFEGVSITLQPESASSPVAFDIKNLTTLRGSTETYKAAEKAEGRKGVLIAEGIQLEGTFANSTPAADENPILWQPTGAANAFEITKKVNGRIDFRGRSRRQRDPATSDSQVEGNGINVRAQVNFGRVEEEGQSAEKRFALKQLLVPSIKLRSGETFAANIESVSDSGITFSSDMYSATLLPNNAIQSIELRRVKANNIPTAKKVDRLLTVPRSSKNDPPTHVLISTEGDFLRGRLISLNSEFAFMEVRLEQVKVPVEKVAQVIWLHDRQWNTSGEKPTTPDTATKNDTASTTADLPLEEPKESSANQQNSGPLQVDEVIALFRNGLRLAVTPTSATPSQIMGTNSLLGDCRIPLAEVDLLMLGPNSNEQANQLADNPWKLSLAKLPAEPIDGGGDGTSGGNQSPLVGQPAPEIELQTADGEAFKLSALKGKVVVLDFWASWCGPCMQTMPRVDEIVGEVPADTVQLVAVNLEEPAERAKAALERLQLKTRIALDIDGVAAQKYQAAAIPQTVIIDREGTIQHVFIGGGEQFLKNFREALKTVIETPQK